MFSFDFNGVGLSASDFPRTLQGWVAYSIAFAGSTMCANKEKALELLMYEAERIIEQVESGAAPPWE